MCGGVCGVCVSVWHMWARAHTHADLLDICADFVELHEAFSDLSKRSARKVRVGAFPKGGREMSRFLHLDAAATARVPSQMNPLPTSPVLTRNVGEYSNFLLNPC